LLVKLLDLLFMIGIIQIEFVGEGNYYDNKDKTLSASLSDQHVTYTCQASGNA